MDSQTSKDLPPEDTLWPGSGAETVGAATNDLAAQISSQVHVSWSGVTEVGQADSTDTVASEGVPEAKNSLSDAERAALFAELRTTLTMKENCEGAPAAGVIEAALMKNPKMMLSLKRLQDRGAKLVVTDFKEGQYVDFADAALNLDIPKQEAGLIGLTRQERNDAIETIIAPLGDDSQKAMVGRTWFLSQLRRSDNVRGLNWAEAMVFAVAHGGTLISYKLYDAMAQRDPSVFENTTWTWYFENLWKVMKSGDAPDGFRGKDEAFRVKNYAVNRRENHGVRVAGLRVEIA